MQVVSDTHWTRERSSPVDSASDRALVRKHARYSALIFGGGTSDERRVVDDTILGGVALGLERPEESLEDIGKYSCSDERIVYKTSAAL